MDLGIAEEDKGSLGSVAFRNGAGRKTHNNFAKLLLTSEVLRRYSVGPNAL